MKYRANKVADLFCQVKDGSGYVECPNVTGFSTPEVSFGTSELGGAGMIGTVNIPDASNLEAMEASVTTTADTGSAKLLNDPRAVEIVLNWAVDQVGTDGSTEYIAYRAVIKGKATTIPGGERKKGEAAECEHKLAAWFYKLSVDGKTVVLIDMLAPKCEINGEDLLAKLNKALNK